MTAPSLPLIGGCLCGAIRYEVRARPFLIVACHCRDCQKRTSSAYSMNMPTRADDFVITQGAPIDVVMPTPSGSTTTHVYCGACHSRLASRPHKSPGMASVRPGTLDDTSWLVPSVHIFARSALKGAIPPGAAQFETDPPDFTPFAAQFAKDWETLA
ncbi:MAG: GFA family protein [Hyphomonadaceae bacterium]